MNSGSQKIMISVENLTRRFQELIAVDHLSFEIRKNEIFGLLGPNGAGKTTTISMICGLLPVSEGTIRFTGHEQPGSHKSIIGYCPQENIFYPKLTCLEQLIFIGQMYDMSLKQVKPRALELLQLMGLKEKTHVRAGKLSGGMKRRLNICLALVHNPGIIILDEPEAGLDPQSRILVRDFIKLLGKDKTVILTTHNMDEADRLADRVAIIDYGKLLLLDTPGNLKKTIGEGDILELSVTGGNEHAFKTITEKIKPVASDVKIHADRVWIKQSNIIEKLPAIKSIADAAGLTITEIKLRENTLEDVFIHLTGRDLRQ